MLGAGNMLQFRLYFYVLFAVLWALLYVRNRDRLGVIGGLSLPVLYVMNMIGEYNVCVLSDQLQAFGMAVLFLEFCRYYDIKRIDWKMSVWVAAAILLSFGSAFVSAFGIFAILVGVIGAEAGESHRSHQKLGVAVGTEIPFTVPTVLLHSLIHTVNCLFHCVSLGIEVGNTIFCGILATGSKSAAELNIFLTCDDKESGNHERLSLSALTIVLGGLEALVGIP